MHVEQLYTGCLAEAAYYIESNGEAVIIDPLREPTPYLEMAKKRGTKIKYVFLTHFHADFVSGHVDLAKKTGAQIVFGPNATAEFNFHVGTDSEIFEVGNVKIKLLHTPGHTMESSSYLLLDENGKEHSVYTGDTLFIGDVGRPDLAVKSNLSQEDLAGHLYDSLRTKLMVLPNNVTVYPGHGAGSACGKNMSSETFDTLGHQKEVNYALRADMSKEEFVKEVLTGLTAPPQYFPKNVGMNKGINTNYDEILEKGLTPLSAKEITQLVIEKNALILDVRPTEEFIKEHIANSLFIGLDGDFAPWVGTLIEDITTPIIVVVPEGKEEEVVTRLSRVGYDNTLGYLKGGINAWKQEELATSFVNSITVADFANQLNENSNIVDVRKITEYFSEHVTHNHIQNTPLGTIQTNFSELSPNKEYYIHCAAGYRSVIATSILKQKGYTQLINVEGGFDAIKNNKKIVLSEYVCPSTI